MKVLSIDLLVTLIRYEDGETVHRDGVDNFNPFLVSKSLY